MPFEQVKHSCGEPWCVFEGILQIEKHIEKPASSKKKFSA